MNRSKGGSGAASTAGTPAASGGSPSVKGKGNVGSSSSQNSPGLDQLNNDMADISLGSGKESGWEVIAKKSRNRAGSKNLKPQSSSSTAPNAWNNSEGVPRRGRGGVGRNNGNNRGQATDSWKPAGRGNPTSQPPNADWPNWDSTYRAQPPAIRPPLQHGWQPNAWGRSRGGFSGSQPRSNVLHEEDSVVTNNSKYDTVVHPEADDSDDDQELLDDSDCELSDEYDSDASQKSHETRKKNKWLKPLFEALDALSLEQINEQTRQWHCPACHDGPGAIDWYKGLQPLVAHAKTKGKTRVKLHRELASLLEEELQRRGTSVIPAGEVFGKWKGLRETTADHEIVWPPMVIIMNTLLDQDENDKWIGMGNQELLEYFNAYAAVRARHSYGPNGHRGMSVLIFETTAIGYMEAELLHRQFEGEGRDRDAWERRPVKFYPGGQRQLYGYLARKEDIDIFNNHSAGKSRLKFELKSYQEMVVIPMRQMREDNQQLIYFKNKFVQQKEQSKAFAENFGLVSQKLKESMRDNKIVKLRSKMHDEEKKQEMDSQEQFFNEQLKRLENVHKATEARLEQFEKKLQEEHTKAKQADVGIGTNEDCRQRKEALAKVIDSQEKGIKDFEAEREELMRLHEEKKVELKHKHLKEDVELAEEFDSVLTKLMQKYAPNAFQASNNS